MCAVQTVHQARLEQANGNGRAGGEERVLPDHKASLQAKDAELQVPTMLYQPGVKLACCTIVVLCD